MSQRVLLCPPTYFDVLDSKNPYMSGKSPVNRQKARQQWENLCAALRQCGCEVETIGPVPGLEDMVFAANPAFVGSSRPAGKFVVPSHMVHPSREREVAHYVEWYRQRGYKVVDLNLGADRFEGHGDAIWHPDGSRIYAGYGFRTTQGGADKLATMMSTMAISVVPLQLVNPYCYHLDTSLCPLNNHAVLVYPGAFSPASLATLRPYWKCVYELTEEEARGFMGNGIVAGERYITSHTTPHLDEMLGQEGLTPLIVDTSEFEKSGGSCFCMKAFLPE
jgi:N-dimethylarginine dimethylaminohydrolase